MCVWGGGESFILINQRIGVFEDAKGVIIIHISKTKRQHNGQNTNNDLQNIHIQLEIK
jgi:hypothetical protein